MDDSSITIGMMIFVTLLFVIPVVYFWYQRMRNKVAVEDVTPLAAPASPLTPPAPLSTVKNKDFFWAGLGLGLLHGAIAVTLLFTLGPVLALMAWGITLAGVGIYFLVKRRFKMAIGFVGASLAIGVAFIWFVMSMVHLFFGSCFGGH